MYNFSDDELDAFFKKATEADRQPAFSSEAWRKMEQKLDRQQRFRVLARWLLGASVFVVLVGGWWWLGQADGPQAAGSTEPPVRSEAPVGVPEPGERPNQGQTLPPVQPQADTVAQRQGVRGPDLARTGEREPRRAGQPTTDLAETTGKKTTKRPLGRADRPVAQGQKNRGRRLAQRPTDQTASVSETVWPKSDPQVPNDQLRISLDLLPTLPTKRLSLDYRPDSLAPAPVAVAPALAAPEGLALSPLPRVVLGLVVSPDVSYTDMSALARVGSKLGLEVELRLAKRWSVATGLVYSAMHYETAPENYKVPGYTNPWPGPSKPYWASGACRVVEVPVNLRFNFGQTPRRRFFASAGLSSYLMLKEDYTFNFYNPTSNRYWNWDYDVDNQNRHWFSIANFSVGYSRWLTKRVGVQVEPFVRLPLTGLGAGSLNVNTAGMFFSVRYGLGRR
jgi:hypothetical protein